MRALMVLWVSLWIAACGDNNNSNGGNEGPGGGDITAQKAAELASEIVATVRAAPRLFPEVPIADLQAAVGRARIIIRERTFANGVETDATNDGVDLIELSRQRWRLITDKDRRMALLFHELLGLMGLEKNTYQISNRLLSPKNRFADEATYDCQAPTKACKVTMRFDLTLNGFVVQDHDCGQFPSYPLSIFRRLTSTVYSTIPGCEAEQGDGSPGQGPIRSCSREPGPSEWNVINFMDGYRFFFSGVYERANRFQMHCSRL